MNEWPLLLFTFLMQTSIGLSVMLALFAKKLSAALPHKTNTQFLQQYVFVACVFAGVGLLSSITHLGVPLNAPNSLLNIFSSWLSREVVFTATYFAFLGLTFLWLWFKKELSFLLLGLAIIAGLCDVYAMASIYRYTSMLTWMNDNTYLMFYGTMLTAGAAGYYLLINLLLRFHAGSPAAQVSTCGLWVLWAVIGISLLIRLVYQPIYENYLVSTSYHNESITFPIDSIHAYQRIWSLRITSWVVGILAVILLGYGLFRHMRQTASGVMTSSSKGYLVVGFAAAIIAEFMLRYCFYTIHL
ncbi:DmsC/YnfH family molybdoenzyme membrane anchor subunit [Providencia rettgeri]|uniref:dimethyl sulfoxide reductase anchor subunit family protein n=1 Tax=Providencia TaxID=586 RepID=UPI00109D2F0C|nr:MULTISPECIES: DmsC/YnfH family molybdoenzyme membrane anchor subunit [Providencia]MBQ0530771.1 dimethyl sulfoxide reductase anchor subunit [Providencia rettgeri]THB28204.1 reductase [Providencia sp. MGF014]WOB86791.1 dimethyl sulfoxide reductase anchor subunit [Providencia sp. PROV040]